MSRIVVAAPLSEAAFAPFGEAIRLRDRPDRIINRGLCGRHHDLAAPDIEDGRAGISLFDALPRALPLRLDLMERHPLGSQAFLPLSLGRFLVTVAPDAGGRPGRPLAFIAGPGEGVNIGRGIWHGVLTPLTAPGLFAVLDRIGEGPNLEEAEIDPPWEIVAP